MEPRNHLVYELERTSKGIGRLGLHMPHQVYERVVGSKELKKTIDELGSRATNAISADRDDTHTTIFVNDGMIGRAETSRRAALLGSTIALINGIDVAAHLERMPDPRLKARFNQLSTGRFANELTLVWPPDLHETSGLQISPLSRNAMIAVGVRLHWARSYDDLAQRVDANIDDYSREITLDIDKAFDSKFTSIGIEQMSGPGYADLAGRNIFRSRQQLLGLVGATAIANTVRLV
ncbi:MAG: hypothetical protein JWO35_468 [Candidatus Saccharibacteria bacterium]|nr:hypothetical protein [Candidatus Saccharibacteria bacterium]